MTTLAVHLKDRPPRSAYEMVLETVGAIGLLLHGVLVMASWSSLPERIPHHFNLAGVPDGWGGKWVLLLMPAIAAVFYGGLTVIALNPRVWNWPVTITPENAAPQYAVGRSMLTWLKVEVAWLLLVITWSIVSVARGAAKGLGAWFVPVFVGAVFLTIIVHLILAFRWRSTK